MSAAEYGGIDGPSHPDGAAGIPLGETLRSLATGYQRHETFTGVTRTPIVSNNNNFARAAPGEPVLMSLDDAQTLFHEFGHALHGLLSEVDYPGARHDGTRT
ncbi:MAG TPA: M3 family metallopeptidase [Gemmatimonadales bacterium]|nr:M3 family metallopeptidase [Gemmatimonadales bacterium]